MSSDRISPSAVVNRSFIFESAPFASCHAATLVESRGQLLAAWFGGSKEGKPDVCIWLSRHSRSAWTSPVMVADGFVDDGVRYPCWNPVLFAPRSGPLTLFYKVGPSPSKWWGMCKTSTDGGQSWSPARRLPSGVLGPAKNKPVQLASGDVLSPCSAEIPDAGWHVYVERSVDDGATFHPLPWIAQGDIPKATQPSILVHSPTKLQMLGRTTSFRLFESWSGDGGKSWSPLNLTSLPNCNSGIDAVTLRTPVNGMQHALVYNHSNLEKVRYPLNVAVSPDGREWFAAAELEADPPGQYSYPCIIQSETGMLHVAYTYKRRTIAHMVLDPSRFEPSKLSDAFTCPPPGSPTHRADEFQ